MRRVGLFSPPFAKILPKNPKNPIFLGPNHIISEIMHSRSLVIMWLTLMQCSIVAKWPDYAEGPTRLSQVKRRATATLI